MDRELYDLNEHFFNLYGRLYENSEQLPKEQTDSMAKKLLAKYEREYEKLRLREEIEQEQEIYELNLKRQQLIPRTWRKWFRRRCNRAAAISAEVVRSEVERYFEARCKALAAAEEEQPAQLQDGEQTDAGETAEATTKEEQPAEAGKTPAQPQDDEQAERGQTAEATTKEEQPAEAGQTPAQSQNDEQAERVQTAEAETQRENEEAEQDKDAAAGGGDSDLSEKERAA